MEDKKSTNTDARKKATKKYRENNKDKVKEQRKLYYDNRKLKDPNFLEYKRNKAREYYNRKKNKIMVVFIEQEPEPEPEPELIKEDVKYERYNFFEEPVVEPIVEQKIEPVVEPVVEQKVEPVVEPVEEKIIKKQRKRKIT